jgi:hypothetical protein
MTAFQMLEVSEAAPQEHQCAGCGSWFEATCFDKSCWCSLRCQDEAKAVRYCRRLINERGYGSLANLPPDLLEAALLKLLIAKTGGYDTRARYVPRATRAAVIARDSRKCVRCGQPGTEIDHIDGDSADMSNLRLLCDPCHNAVTWSHVVVGGDTDDGRAGYLRRRIEASTPLVPGDAADWTTLRHSWLQEHTRHAGDGYGG